MEEIIPLVLVKDEFEIWKKNNLKIGFSGNFTLSTLRYEEESMIWSV